MYPLFIQVFFFFLSKLHTYINLCLPNFPRANSRVPTAQGKQGKWQKKIPVRENTGNLEILHKHRENTGNFVCSSRKFPDS